jgi:hypothetical protein
MDPHRARSLWATPSVFKLSFVGGESENPSNRAMNLLA